jgi:HNH endonuclease
MNTPLQLVDGAKPKRKSINKKTRFEVFKRDGFKCQYCGKCAPEVVLNVDHIHPVSKSGGDDMMNFVTACADCNSGKSDRLLSDDSAITKQRQQLEELNERRDQLEMMLKWRDGLKSMDADSLAKIVDAWEEIAPGLSPNERGMNDARKMLKDFGLIAILDAIETAGRQYIKHNDDGELIPDSAQTAWMKLGGICRMSTIPESMRKLFYARGILRKRVYVNERAALTLMKNAVAGGMDPDEIIDCARNCRNWTEFSSVMQTWAE